MNAQESKQSDGVIADQASRGGEVYERECAACHRSDFQGSFEAPKLAGPNFLNNWAELSPAELFDLIKASMPIDQPGRHPTGYYIYLTSIKGVGSYNYDRTLG